MKTFTLILIVYILAAVPAQGRAQSRPPDAAGKKDSLGRDTAVFPRMDTLGKVTIIAPRNTLKVENGRITMNVSNSALTTGSSVFDLLKKMPGISVSQDENISLRGSEGVQVLIDGKMNYLSGKQLADLLKSLNGDDIARIEIITSPAADFDAAGNAGIINIVTKKRTVRGYAIDLRTAVTKGAHWMLNKNITASLHSKKLGLFASFDYNTPHRQVKGESGNTVSENGSIFKLYRINTNDYKIKFYTYKLGADWQLSQQHQLSVHYHGYFDDFKAPKDATVLRYSNDQQLHSVVRTKTTITEPYHYDAANLSWAWKIDSTGKTLVTEAHYISYRNLSDALMESTLMSASSGEVTDVNTLRSHQPGYIRIRSFKSDLEWPYKTVLFKGGLKFAHVSNDNNYRFDSLVDGIYKEAGSMSNHFLYNEKIAAAYLSVSKKINRTNVQAGLRIEHTDAKGYTVKEEFKNSWQYTNLFPSLAIGHEQERHKLHLSLSRRINRPTYSDLNPVRWYTDQYFYYSGNPGLVPEMAWLLSAAWTLHRKYIVTATYGFRENYITKRLVIDSMSGAVKSQTANFGKMKRLDLLFSAPFHAGSWNMQVSAGVNYSHYPVPQTNGTLTASRWAANLQAQQQLKLPGGIQLELAAWYYTKELWGIYLKKELFYMDAGIKKTFLKNDLSVQLSFSDLLRTYQLRAASISSVTDYRYKDRPDAHRIGLSIRYHIGGKLQAKKVNVIEEQERL
jgi:hypothetical protein